MALADSGYAKAQFTGLTQMSLRSGDFIRLSTAKQSPSICLSSEISVSPKLWSFLSAVRKYQQIFESRFSPHSLPPSPKNRYFCKALKSKPTPIMTMTSTATANAMSFELSEEQLMIQQAARDLAQNEIISAST